MAALVGVALLFAACGPRGSTPAPLATQPVSSPTSAVVAAPPAPTNFTATRTSGSVPCPGADGDCTQTDLAWQSSADSGTWFRVYWAGTGEDPAATCLTVQTQATIRLDTAPAARSAQLFDPMAVGGGETCYWITAVVGFGYSL
jgi:hypothetical protein